MVIDIETTGLSPKNDRILELALVRTDHFGRPLAEWSSRMNPEGPVGATHIHGITDDDVRNAPTFAHLAPFIASQLAGHALVCHNAKFDLAFLQNEFRRAGWDWPQTPHLCTLQASRSLLPQLHRYTLEACCHAAGFAHVDQHNALGDARATTRLLQTMLALDSKSKSVHQFHRLPNEARRVQWPTLPSRSPQRTPERKSLPKPPIRKQNSRKTEAAPLISQISASSVLEHVSNDNAANYVEVLLLALADHELTESESQALAELQQMSQLSDEEVTEIHRAVAASLADNAVADDIFSKHERTEIKTVLMMLGIPEKLATRFFREAQKRRYVALSQGLPPLPDDWNVGEPLHVGDNVVFTGVDDALRSQLENQLKKAGVYLASGVSKKTVMLVTDGSFSGKKLDKATELGTRIVTPAEFEKLLTWIQPFEG